MNRGPGTCTQIMGVIGSGFRRLPHTQAPVQRVFRAVLDKCGIEGDYYLFDLQPEELTQFIDAAKVLCMPGFGVTMPYKQAIVSHLDHLSRRAKLYGAVNLVLIRDGQTYGYMTDGIGFCGVWDDRKYTFENKRILMIGAGAISRTICCELTMRGAKQFTICNRSEARARELAAQLTSSMQVSAQTIAFESDELDKAAAGTDVLIQTTSLGMDRTGTQYPYLGFIDHLSASAIVCDVITSPLETALLRAARARGLQTSDGADMLCYQMQPTMQLYFGTQVPDAAQLTPLAQRAFRGE